MRSSKIVKIILLLGIIFSIAVTYYVMIVQKDFKVFTNPDGLPELDE